VSEAEPPDPGDAPDAEPATETDAVSTALLTTSTVLPQMQGAMSATQDEIAWAMTFNILATAVVTPMTGWLVARFGRRGVVVEVMAATSQLPSSSSRRFCRTRASTPARSTTPTTP